MWRPAHRRVRCNVNLAAGPPSWYHGADDGASLELDQGIGLDGHQGRRSTLGHPWAGSRRGFRVGHLAELDRAIPCTGGNDTAMGSVATRARYVGLDRLPGGAVDQEASPNARKVE